jgi:hypothetical protein
MLRYTHIVCLVISCFPSQLSYLPIACRDKTVPLHARRAQKDPIGTALPYSTLVPTPAPLYLTDKDPVIILQKPEWASGMVVTDPESLALPLGFEPRTVQHVASHYTECDIPAPMTYVFRMF